MESKYNLTADIDLTAALVAGEHALFLLQELMEEFFSSSPETEEGRNAIVYEYRRAEALASSVELQVRQSVQALKDLGASR